MMNLILNLESGQTLNFKHLMWNIQTLRYAAVRVTEHIMQDKKYLDMHINI